MLITTVRNKWTNHNRFLHPCGGFLQALNTAVHGGSPQILLRAILSLGVGEALHPAAVRHAVLYADKCLEEMGIGDVFGGGLGDGVDSLALTALVGKGLECVAPDTAEASGRIMERCVPTTFHL